MQSMYYHNLWLREVGEKKLVSEEMFGVAWK